MHRRKKLLKVVYFGAKVGSGVGAGVGAGVGVGARAGVGSACQRGGNMNQSPSLTGSFGLLC